MTARIDTEEGTLILDEFIDDSGTIPLEVPPDLTPAMLRLLSEQDAAAYERAAQRLENLAGGRDVLISTSRAAAILRGRA